MKFHLDKQTIQDLELFKEGSQKKSIFDIFNRVKTFGGRVRLMDMMNAPSSDKVLLQSRLESIQFFFKHNLVQDISNQQFDFIDHYLKSNLVILKNNKVDITAQKIKNAISSDKDYYLISTGIQYILFAIKNLNLFIKKFDSKDLPKYLHQLTLQVQNFIEIKEIKQIIDNIDLTKRENDISINISQIFFYDHFFRKTQKANLEILIEIIFEFDVFSAIAQSTKKYGLSFPVYSNSKHCTLDIKGLFNPLIEHPIKNNFSIDDKNICFLTGPNMAGKSTFLKSIGLTLYLAHLGFPVPAKSCTTSIFNGLMTTINLSDNIDLGYSHFLSEVKRVKEAAIQIKNHQKYFVIFDELFKGTNVKDAYEASVLIINAFAKIKNSAFIISTHLIEIANEINENENISFKYLETKLNGSEIDFSYKIKEGISKDRLGIIIVKNEGILDILNEITSPT